MIDLEELDKLVNEVLGENWEQEKKTHIAQMKLTYNNLRENHPLKESMRKYIDYFENGEEKSGIKMNEATRLYHVLEDAGLIKDRSGEELWKQIQERETGVKITAEIVNFSGKVGDIVDKN